MKRRRSRTNEFLKNANEGVSYGDYLDDNHENMLDEVISEFLYLD